MECHTNTSRDRTCLCRLPVMAALLAAASLVACGGGSIETTAASDREALVAFYNSADGDNWTDKSEWLSDRPTGQWYGVKLGSLTNLQVLSLWGNELRGEIPAELGSLSNLQRLNLSFNLGLSGPLPGSLTGLNALSRLDLRDTQLCAPSDDAFQRWLLGVLEKSGVVTC